MKIDWRVATVAIVCIAGLEAYALYQRIDGAVISLAFAAIAGIAGFKLGRK